MYICVDCNRAFERPNKIHIIHDELPERSKETYRVCPYCESEVFEIAETCSLCESYINKEQSRFGLCSDCEISAEQRFEDFLKEEFTENELNYLNNQYDGRYFGEQRNGTEEN